MATIEELKKEAAHRAVEQIRSGMVVGLGTGSTAVHAVRRLGALLADGTLRDIVAIPTSEETAANSRQANIPLTTLDDHPAIDLTIDGADEFDPALNVIKGLGGALLREKVVAAASARFVIIVDERKQVDRLGTTAPVPVEVIRFAERPVWEHLERLGATITRRERPDGEPFITDEGNYILDAHFGPMVDPAGIARAIIDQPGVVDHGLFLGMVDEVIMAGMDGIEVFTRPSTATDQR